MKRFILLLTVHCAFFGFLSVSAQTEKLPIAVLDLDANGVKPSVAGVLTENVRYEFGKHSDLFDLVAREKMEQLAKEKAFQLTGCTDVACAVQIGKALNVKKIIVGSVGKLGQKYQVFLRAVDVEKENVVCNEREEGSSEEEKLDQLVPALVFRVYKCLWGGKNKEDEEAARETIHLKPNDAEAHDRLGELLARQEKYEEAEKEFREAIRLKSDYALTHSNLARVLFEQYKCDEAIKECREAIRLKPDLAEAHSILGNALSWQSKPEEAERECREAIRLNPNLSEAHINLGSVLEGQGKIEGAIAEYNEAIRLEPGNGLTHYFLGMVFKDQGKTEEEIAELREAIRLQPDDGVSHICLGNALGVQGRNEEAENEYREAIRLKVGYAGFYDLGLMLMDEGRFQGAEKEFREAIPYTIKAPLIYSKVLEVLATGLDAQAKRKEAREYWEKALKVRKDNFPREKSEIEKLEKRLSEPD